MTLKEEVNFNSTLRIHLLIHRPKLLVKFSSVQPTIEEQTKYQKTKPNFGR